MPFDGTQLSPVTQALIAGRRRIEEGWCQGAMRTREGVCAVGAISYNPKAVEVLYRAFGGRSSIPRWNDTPGRSREDVLALYDRAIALSLNS
jgi:hypothetical protein